MEGDGKRWKAPTDLVTAEDSDAFMDAFVCHTAMRSNSYATIQPACMLVNVFARRSGILYIQFACPTQATTMATEWSHSLLCRPNLATNLNGRFRNAHTPCGCEMRPFSLFL